MLIVGLTGGIATGKSTVAAMFGALGAAVVDADRLAHALQAPGEPCHRQIVDTFGPGVLDAAGRIDRRRLGGLVFADPPGRRRLEAIMHPAIRQACQGEIPAGDEGPGKTEPMVIPDVGDDRYGDLTNIGEAGGGAYWLLHNSLVRKGPVLMDLQVVDIVMGDGVQPEFTTEEIGAFLTGAVDKLA